MMPYRRNAREGIGGRGREHRRSREEGGRHWEAWNVNKEEEGGSAGRGKLWDLSYYLIHRFCRRACRREWRRDWQGNKDQLAFLGWIIVRTSWPICQPLTLWHVRKKLRSVWGCIFYPPLPVTACRKPSPLLPGQQASPPSALIALYTLPMQRHGVYVKARQSLCSHQSSRGPG